LEAGGRGAGAVERLLALGQLAAALHGDGAAEVGGGHGVGRGGRRLRGRLRAVRRALAVGHGRWRAGTVSLLVLGGGRRAGTVQRLLALGQLAAALGRHGAAVPGGIPELGQLSAVGGVDRVHPHGQPAPPR
jgi:hypothetical protein